MSQSTAKVIKIVIPLIILIALLVIVLAMCSQRTPTPAPATSTLTETSIPIELVPTQTPQDNSWQKVQQAGVLRVGTTADYPPFEYYNDKLELTGFDIALIQQIGQRLGVNVEMNNFAFDTLPAAVAAGQVDVAIGALSVTPERQAVANFSNVYYAGSDAVLTRPEADPKNVQNPQTLAAMRLGVQRNSIYQTYAQQQLIDTGLMPIQNLMIYIDTTQAVNDLKANRLDAVWMDLKPAQTFVSAGGVKIIIQDLNQQLFAIGMMKDANALRDRINEALTQLQNDGTLANLQIEYLGIKPENVVTPQPLPTMTPQATPVPAECVHNAKWIGDLSYDDKEGKNPPVLNPGQPFTKGWRMQNNGTCTWKSGYNMAYSYGNVPAAQMGGQPILISRDVKPGEMYDFQVNLIAPVVPGDYQGFWNVRSSINVAFGETVWVYIRVPGKATSTPPPTQTPVPDIDFDANPTTITKGQSVLFEWDTDNVKEVYFYHDGQNWWEHQVDDDGESEEWPPYSMKYYLYVVQNNDKTVVREKYITVNPAPVELPEIVYFDAKPPQVKIGECFTINWQVTGNVERVVLLYNNSVIQEGVLQGNYPECPNVTGMRTYTLEATGLGGTAKSKTSADVISEPPTATPVPDVPTNTPEPPTPTPTPTQPVPQPPVIDYFGVDPNTIEEGQCAMASWNTSGGTTGIQILLNGEWQFESGDLNSSTEVCPPIGAPATVNYTLVAYNNAGQQESRDAQLQIVPSPPQNPLANTSWSLQSMQGSGDVPPEVSITAYFGAEGGLSGNGGCNSYTTSYVANGDVITIYPPAGTGALCGDPTDSLEQAYLGLLPQAANLEINNGQLIIRGNEGQEILRYNSID